MIFERDLTDLCFAGLRPNIREKLEDYEFVNVNQLLRKAVSVESCLKESCDAYRSHRPNVHVIDGYSDGLDDENKKCYAAEIRWPSENKLVTCPSLKPNQTK
jgi:hypothetical protein